MLTKMHKTSLESVRVCINSGNMGRGIDEYDDK